MTEADRIAELEAEGLTHSDAIAVIEAGDLPPLDDNCNCCGKPIARHPRLTSNGFYFCRVCLDVPLGADLDSIPRGAFD